MDDLPEEFIAICKRLGADPQQFSNVKPSILPGIGWTATLHLADEAQQPCLHD